MIKQHNLVLKIYWKIRKLVIFIPQKLGFLNLRAYHVWGKRNRLHIGNNVSLANAIINTRSGDVYICDNVFLSHNVMVLTGWHDYHKKGLERIYTVPSTKGNIHIYNGVWIGAGAIILGGVTIGENAVIGAGSVVTKNVEKNTMVAGNPAKFIKKIDFSE